MQPPLLQTWLAAQALPHMPQSIVLLARLTHWPEQLTVPEGHLQAPPEHEAPPVHVSPQPPQLLLSFCTSTQDFPHAVKLVAHCAEQTPVLHTGWLAPHAVAQPPQLFGSVCSFTHEPEQ